MDIKLTFRNDSVGAINNKIVIFQKNVAESFDEIAVAWRVIEECGVKCYHPFTYPMEFYVGGRDSYGNHIEKQKASVGDSYEIFEGNSGHDIQTSGKASSGKDVEVNNNLPKGSVAADIYKDGRLLATKQNIVPKQKAVFQFQPKLYIGAVSEIVEGEVMKSAVISQINTELDLLGIDSADIVMTGGGSGKGATGYTFKLANVKYV